jgi:protein required for attachment to host cells
MKPLNTPAWFVVADASRARILSRMPGHALQLVHVMEHPESRLKSSELGDDRRGRELSGRGFGGAAFEARTDAHTREHLKFAHRLAQYVEHEARANAFACLDIFAASPFLGELKKELGGVSQKRLAAAHDVDLTHLSLAQLEVHFSAKAAT